MDRRWCSLYHIHQCAQAAVTKCQARLSSVLRPLAGQHRILACSGYCETRATRETSLHRQRRRRQHVVCRSAETCINLGGFTLLRVADLPGQALNHAPRGRSMHPPHHHSKTRGHAPTEGGPVRRRVVRRALDARPEGRRHRIGRFSKTHRLREEPPNSGFEPLLHPGLLRGPSHVRGDRDDVSPRFRYRAPRDGHVAVGGRAVLRARVVLGYGSVIHALCFVRGSRRPV